MESSSLPPLNPLLKASGKRTWNVFAACPDDNLKVDEKVYVYLLLYGDSVLKLLQCPRTDLGQDQRRIQGRKGTSSTTTGTTRTGWSCPAKRAEKDDHGWSCVVLIPSKCTIFDDTIHFSQLQPTQDVSLPQSTTPLHTPLQHSRLQTISRKPCNCTRRRVQSSQRTTHHGSLCVLFLDTWVGSEA